jgi:hypothetical protein
MIHIEAQVKGTSTRIDVIMLIDRKEKSAEMV